MESRKDPTQRREVAKVSKQKKKFLQAGPFASLRASFCALVPNVGMIQSGGGPRLALEPLQGHSIGSQSIGQELQGNVAPQRRSSAL